MTTGDDKTPRINGAIMPRMGPNSVWNTVDAEKLNEVLKKIEKAGGRVITPKREVPNVIWMAYCQDSEGARDAGDARWRDVMLHLL